MRSKVRAYSHQGHGPRAEQQAGYISATSDSTPSVAKGSRSIHVGHLHPYAAPAVTAAERRLRTFPPSSRNKEVRPKRRRSLRPPPTEGCSPTAAIDARADNPEDRV